MEKVSLAWRAPALPATVLIIALLGACGQKGPLQIPGMGRDAPWPTRVPDASAPAAATPQPAAPPAGGNPAQGSTAPRQQ